MFLYRRLYKIRCTMVNIRRSCVTCAFSLPKRKVVCYALVSIFVCYLLSIVITKDSNISHPKREKKAVGLPDSTLNKIRSRNSFVNKASVITSPKVDEHGTVQGRSRGDEHGTVQERSRGDEHGSVQIQSESTTQPVEKIPDNSKVVIRSSVGNASQNSNFKPEPLKKSTTTNHPQKVAESTKSNVISTKLIAQNLTITSTSTRSTDQKVSTNSVRHENVSTIAIPRSLISTPNATKLENVTITGLKNDTGEQSLKEILMWTSYYIDPYYGLHHFGRQGFIDNKCSINTCIITNDKSRLSSVDAVVVHMRNYDMNPLPKRQNHEQIFVFYLFESPPASFWNKHFSVPSEDKRSFNLTITYRYDSDISMPGTGKPVLMPEPHKSYRPVTPLKDRQGTVIWMSSHCNTTGMREKYIKSLAKYIHVDIYGRCGWLKCPLHDPYNQEMDMKYKFYISAENSVCKDYVSEKIHHGLNKEVIPLVYGGLDYEKRLPPHSFIDITKFPSPQKLAQYLDFLSKNETEYWKYFEWKTKYRRVGVSKESLMCSLCEKLHDPDYHKVYPDVVKWWKEDTCNTNFMDSLISQKLV